jgi:hypothetical protein
MKQQGYTVFYTIIQMSGLGHYHVDIGESFAQRLPILEEDDFTSGQRFQTLQSLLVSMLRNFSDFVTFAGEN